MKYPFILSLGLALALSTATFAAPPPVDDDDDGTGSLFKGLMEGSGLLGKTKNSIDYKERAPLVLPSQAGVATLPTPQQSASTKSANWPKDPDAERIKREEERKKRPQVQRDASRKLTQEELNRGWVSPNADKSHLLDEAKPFENKRSGGMFKKDEEAKIEFKGEGNRTSLIQPPPGYRTPSANQPYGPVGKTDYTVEVKDPYKK
jgi:hypothetical protein